MTPPDRPKQIRLGELHYYQDHGGHWQYTTNAPPRPTPPGPIPNIHQSLSGPGSVLWSEWVQLKPCGASLRSWWDFIRKGGMVDADEYSWAIHLRYVGEHRCHSIDGVTYCYHRDPHIHPELRDIPTDKPIAKEGESFPLRRRHG